MPRYVAFLRAINVGGHVVKMERLRMLFDQLRFRNVETFIASGNVLFDSSSPDTAAMERKIEKHLEKALGYEVITFVRLMSDLAAVVSGHPFVDVESSGHTLSVGFLKQAPGADAVKVMQRIGTETDEFHVGGREAYWLCRGRTNESKLWGKALQKALGAPTTFRNMTTVKRLAARVPPPA